MECPVCFNLYEKSVSVPLALECNHIVCKKCVNKMNKNNTVQCPICLNITSNISKLAISKTILDMIIESRGLNRSQNLEKSKTISFIVRNLKGYALNIKMDKMCTILNLKEKISEAENISISCQWLLHNGKVLDNNDTIKKAEIEDSDIVYLVFRSFGG